MVKNLYSLLFFTLVFILKGGSLALAQASISISSPLQSAEYNLGDPVNISADILSNGGISDPNLPYLKMDKPAGAWRKLKLGYSPNNLWGPLQNVTLTGNDKLDLTLKDLSGTIQWNKVEIRPQGNSTNPVVLGNYMSSALNLGNGWYKLTIPLSDFDQSINFSAISYLEIPYSTDVNPGSMAVSRIIFTGGSVPFEWFGTTKNDNISNGTSLTSDNLSAVLVTATNDPLITRVSFYANGILIGQDLEFPYNLTWTPTSAGNFQISSVAEGYDNSSLTSESVTILVKPLNVPDNTVGNQGLSVSITAPTEGSVLTAGTSVAIAATATLTSASSPGTSQPYLKISKPIGAWRKLKLGYSPANLWSPLQNVIESGNTRLELTLKDLDGTIQWNKMEIRPQGNATNPVVLGNYMSTAEYLGDGWYKVSIPLTDFNTGINFGGISFMELPFSSDDKAFSLAVRKIEFTGGGIPFLWFGDTKTDNIHNGSVLTTDNMLAVLVSDAAAAVVSKVSFYSNGLLLVEDTTSPYTFEWTPELSGNYTLTACALSSDGTSITSAPVTVIANSAPPVNPVADALSVVISFETLPSNFQISKASLRFNKKFAYSLTLDDGLISHYTHAYQVLKGGVVSGQTFPGLFYTDGCGNVIPFKAGLAWYSVNENGKDLHTGDNSVYMTWNQLNEIYAQGWDVLNHSFSHLNRGYNAQGLPNPYLPDSVYAYQVNANTNYTKSHTTEGINLNQFVVPAGDDGYYLPAFKNGMKAVYDQNWQLPGNGFGLLVNNAIDFSNFKLYRATMPDNLTSLNSKIDNTASQCISSDKRYWFNYFTHDVGTPASSGGVQFNTFRDHMNYIASTYGKNGTDAVWMAPLQEVNEYLQVRDAAIVNSQWVGNKLYLSFDLSKVPAGLRRNELSLAVQSDVIFTDVKVTGALQFSFNGTSPTDKLINLSWAEPTNSTQAARLALSDKDQITVPDKTQSISVHPNPANDVLRIHSLAFGDQPVKLSCYSIGGLCFLSKAVAQVNHEVSLNIDQLPSGMYFLKVESEDRVYKIEKFVKL